MKNLVKNTVAIILLSLFAYSCNTKLPKEKGILGNPDLPEQLNRTKDEIQNRDYNTGDVVSCGLVDKAGHLWFGTNKDGVYRYDGMSFTNFTVSDGLCHNEIWAMLEDKDGLLWFGTADGLSTYDGETFTHLPIPSGRHEGAKTVMSLFQDKEEYIWIGTWGNGVHRYDNINFKSFLQETGRIQSDGQYNNAIRSIIQDREGNIWFSSLTHGGITRYDGEHLINYTEQDGLCDDMVFTSFQDSKGNIWIGVIEDGDLCRYDGKIFNHYSKSDGICFNMVSCFYEDKLGNIWFGSETENGLCIYNGEEFTSFSIEGSENMPPVRFILEDTKGNVWIGGRYGGLWCYDGKVLKDYTQAKNGVGRI